MNKQVLVLFSFRNHKNGYIEMLFSRMKAAASGRGLTLDRGALKDLRIEIKNNHLSVIEPLTNRDISEYDLVYFELWYKAQQQALVATKYLAKKKVPFFSKELSGILPITKVGELGILSDSKVPLPHTLLTSRRELLKIFRKNPPIVYPLILKAADGYGGKNNHLVRSYQDLKSILTDNKNVEYVVQEYIPNDRDYRCIVMGGKIRFVLERKRKKSDSHLNNTSAGAEGKEVSLKTLSKEAQTAVLRAAKVLRRDSFSGVDLMIHQGTGRPYILEVNQTPQIEIGAETEAKMQVMLDYMQEVAR